MSVLHLSINMELSQTYVTAVNLLQRQSFHSIYRSADTLHVVTSVGVTSMVWYDIHSDQDINVNVGIQLSWITKKIFEWETFVSAGLYTILENIFCMYLKY